MKQLLLALLVLAAWIGLTSLAAWAVPERDDPNALPDLAFDPHWGLATPPNTPQYDRAPSIRTDVATTVAAQPAPSSPRTTGPRPPPAAAVPNTAGVEQWRDEIAAYGDWNVDTMLAIMRCESGGDPAARNASSGAAGLLQIYPARAGSFDPVTNIAQGHAKWVANGYQPWISSRGCWG